jgi:DNA repair protein RadC
MNLSVQEKAATYGLTALNKEELMTFIGCGDNQEKLTAFKLLNDYFLHQHDQMKTISNSQSVYNSMSFLKDCNHEEFWMLYLTRNNNIIGKIQHSRGGACGTVVDIKLMLSHIFKYEKIVHSVILVHNHPSGNMNPSVQDRTLTKRIKQAFDLVEINLFDHVIIAGNSFYSFADDNQL